MDFSRVSSKRTEGVRSVVVDRVSSCTHDVEYVFRINQKLIKERFNWEIRILIKLLIGNSIVENPIRSIF